MWCVVVSVLWVVGLSCDSVVLCVVIMLSRLCIYVFNVLRFVLMKLIGLLILCVMLVVSWLIDVSFFDCSNCLCVFLSVCSRCCCLFFFCLSSVCVVLCLLILVVMFLCVCCSICVVCL